jgi:hypothetical protein
MRSRRLPRLKAFALSSSRFQNDQASSEIVWSAPFARHAEEWLKSNALRFAAILPRQVRKLKGLGFGAVFIALAVLGCATKSARKPAGEEVSTTARATQPSQPQAKRPFLVGAFSWLPKFSFRQPKPPQAQVPRLIGVIKMVDEDDRFVLIDATTFQGAAAGDLLICIRDQKETANLRMSSLQNPPFLIADIASGKPAPGDRVVKP